MGRIRSDYESPLIRGMTAEVVDLFGIEDTFLFRWSSADNLTDKDPLWVEPATGTTKFKKYKIKCMKVDPDQEEASDAEGRDITATVTLFVSLNHLLGGAVPKDDFGDYVSEGDAIEIHHLGAHTQFDIVKASKTGWVNTTDKFAGYNLTCVRREKYVPERKTSS